MLASMRECLAATEMPTDQMPTALSDAISDLEAFTQIMIDSKQQDGPGRRRSSADVSTISSDALLTHLDALYNYARAMTGSEVSAADLVEKTYIRALAHPEEASRGFHIKCWMLKILRDLWLNRRLDQIERNASKCGVQGESVKGPLLEPQHKSVCGHKRGDVRKLIENLPADSREVLLLREHEDLSYGQIAYVLGCSSENVSHHLVRARLLLRELITVNDCPRRAIDAKEK